MDTLERLKRTKYAVQHDPNCSNPYLVGLVGKGDRSTQPIVGAMGYGKTLEEAAGKAFAIFDTQGIGWAGVGLCTTAPST